MVNYQEACANDAGLRWEDVQVPEERMILAVTCKTCGRAGPGAPTSQMAGEAAIAAGWHHDGEKMYVRSDTHYTCPDHALVTEMVNYQEVCASAARLQAEREADPEWQAAMDERERRRDEALTKELLGCNSYVSLDPDSDDVQCELPPSHQGSHKAKGQYYLKHLGRIDEWVEATVKLEWEDTLVART